MELNPPVDPVIPDLQREDATFLPPGVAIDSIESSPALPPVENEIIKERARESRHLLSEQTDRRFFTLAPVYQLLGVNFDLVQQFVTECRENVARDLDFQTILAPYRLFPDLYYDQEIIQSLPAEVFRKFETWMRMTVFHRSAGDLYWSVDSQRMTVTDPLWFGIGQVTPSIEVTVFTPFSADYNVLLEVEGMTAIRIQVRKQE